MSALEWSDDFELNMPQMDNTHQQFVELLMQVMQQGATRTA